MKHIRSALVSLAWWTVPGLLVGAVVVLFFPTAPEVYAHTWRFSACALVSWWIWAAVTPVVRTALRRVPLERPWLRVIAVHVPLALAGAFVFVLWFSWILWLSQAATLPPEPFTVTLRRSLVGHFAMAVAVYAAVVAVIMTMEERRARRQRELEAARLSADLAQAQLRALQLQLQPHFLFNTLHSIAMLTDSEPAVAEAMAIKLAELLRQTLHLRNVPELALREELELVDAYLDIEKARFRDRLAVTVAVPEPLLDVAVPSFFLQPVVENAVRHGVGRRVGGGCVRVTAACEGNVLLLTVEDDGPGFSGDANDDGVGLSATRDRLALRYGAAASLHIESGAGGGSRVAIRLPMSAP